MAKAVFARKNVEEFSRVEMLTEFTSVKAKLTRFAKDFFMSNRPRNTGDGNRHDEQFEELMGQAHCGVVLWQLVVMWRTAYEA